ncbi:MAG: molybdenum cofactor biosynthesis protein MoaE [Maribacter dokdonensis]|uniref:Molybdopterin synthase catalytic subunit n=1 Tax=Maribacter dokdonensis TaxID=320912 RepID=A0ABY0UJM2_9FLAO|nr:MULTISPECIES: molybdenum cofactor biosynthesis protein MoaE [Maribacter]AOE08957.1 molybdenum cofactor biosynthesis protein MoaE [uncultured bacterium]HAF77420.1 molybdenum cofactor biosynthesis protein MoaE [Maribacter sp.]KSA14396.1 Molybdopterin synthase, large subunit [Maribacter dokdonensis DSW-8]MDP2527783.1 molybdenum cofactor biosynthesis protein MoaE [Maribacter dokdonensis]PHN93260.1 molybdenum cofactor biosynthesis protein MoaE [Maribacter sp. 6B07]|tara:strand:- start:286 stop:702 length:417 start_codon:yes stop_codon:yes gene_type:complete
MKKVIEIVNDIDTAKVYAELSDAKSGGICVFVGAVREFTNNEEVVALEFETYQAMALKEMDKIADKAFEKWTLNKVVMRHAVGEKGVEEPVVVVGASSAHRDACFEACRFLIDTLKETVPIWKKEKFKNKSVWVSAHP